MKELEDTLIADYRIIRHIATGGMANIYLARDVRTQQEVALKLVPTSNQEYCRRFQREAYVVASLHHEHILPALDYGECDGWCYLVMPYVTGGTLRDVTQNRPLKPETAGKYLEQIASALDYAHTQGVIHRDIKASNILMGDEGHVYLADFGLVKNTASVAESLTETGFLVGTAEYMAPELAEDVATELSDIYALGIVLYQMLTGDVPFKGSTAMGTFMQHLSKQPMRPSLVNPDIPPQYDALVLRALAKEPARRYQSAYELVTAYHQVFDGPTRVFAHNGIRRTRVQTITSGLASWRYKKPQRGVKATVAVVALSALLLGPSAYMIHGMHLSAEASLTNTIVQPLLTTGKTPQATSRAGSGAGSTSTPKVKSTPKPTSRASSSISTSVKTGVSGNSVPAQGGGVGNVQAPGAGVVPVGSAHTPAQPPKVGTSPAPGAPPAANGAGAPKGNGPTQNSGNNDKKGAGNDDTKNKNKK